MSTTHDTERLAELVLGELGPVERAEIEAHIAACPDCARERAELAAVLGDLPLALAPASPPPSLLERIGGAVDHLERFARFAPRLGELLGLPVHEVRRALHVYERPEQMRPTLRPGMRAEPIAAGPDRPGVTALLTCFDPGAVVAHHTHHDHEERVVVFQGGFECDDGTAVHAGEELVSAVGTAHANFITSEEPCLCAIIKTGKAPAA